MRRLHLVGFSADQGGFVLATRRGAKTGSFVLSVDAALLEELDRARRSGGIPPGPSRASPSRSGVQSGLTPRDIQARLRAGQTQDEVAAEAGVGVDWIERFAAPVLAEQAAAIQRAARSRLQGGAGHDQSERPLEAAVRRNLAGRGVLVTEGDFQSSWTARHVVDSDWCVAFRFRSRGRDVVAEWTLDTATGVLSARNRVGAELGFIGPETPETPPRTAATRRRRREAPAPPTANGAPLSDHVRTSTTAVESQAQLPLAAATRAEASHPRQG